MKVNKYKAIPGQLPLFEPEANWKLPTVLPNFEGVKILGFDVETRDPHLTSKGPGFIRGDAEVIGYSLSDGCHSIYVPFAHPYGENIPRDIALAYLRQIVGDSRRTLIGANTMYEREALWSLGIEPKATIRDVQIAEPLINEESLEGYSLEKLGKKYLNSPKNEELLREAAHAFGVDPKSGLWQLAPKYVGPYAEWDAWAPVHIWKWQMIEIAEQNLEEVLELEHAVQPILWEMRKRGIPVDVTAAKIFEAQLNKDYDKAIAKLSDKYSRGLPRLDIWSGPILAAYCTEHNIPYPRTKKGNPSFTKDSLESSSYPFLKEIRAARELSRLSGTFVKEWILGNELNGYVHPQWKQLASDDGGTRTGRMAAANPNPQQVPSRSAVGKKIRSLFKRLDGGSWLKADYSQQEPRILTHFAYLLQFDGAAGVRDTYIQDPAADFYQIMVEMAGVDRRQAKDLYLGRCYGMGADKLAAKLRCSRDEAIAILDAFDRRVPFIKSMSDKCEQMAQSRGYIKTLSGRRRHFNMWEPANYRTAKERGLSTLPVGSREEAMEKWPQMAIRRADCRKALNSLIQGSAADMTKIAMVEVYRQTGSIPYMQVHDELNYPVESEEEARNICKIMEDCCNLTVPIRCDMDFGLSWK